MKLRKTIVALLSVSFLLTLTTSAFACACCVERGYYEMTRERPDAFYLGLIGDVDLNGAAELYDDESGFDSVKGLGDLEKEYADNSVLSFSVAQTFTQRTWRLNIKSKGGRAGTLVLPMPAIMVRHKVDIHDAEESGMGVSLYKEFTFNGTVSRGTGVFRSANTKPTKYTLIFQGNGNGCDDPSNFANWRLELNGPRTDFAIFGKLKSGPKNEPAPAN